MLSFLSFLLKEETRYYLWEAAPQGTAQLFHKDIGIPQSLTGPTPGMRLKYGEHAKRAAMDDGLRFVPLTLPTDYTVIEIEATNGRPSKWVLRMPLKDTTRDIVLVVLPDGFVKTIWTNDRNDKHSTLRRHLYTSPAQFVSR